MPLDATPNIPKMPTTQWSGVSPIIEQKLWSPSARKRLKELAALPVNWDGYGSNSIEQAVIEIAQNLLSDFAKLNMPEPKILPVPGGGIQLEWDNAGVELEVEILTDETIEYLIVDKEGKMHEGQMSQYPKVIEIAGFTRWFTSERPCINNLSNIYVSPI